MTTSAVPSTRHSFTSPVIDCEPPPVDVAAVRHVTYPPPTLAAGHRGTHDTGGPLVAFPHAPVHQVLPRAAAVFADGALRRVLEVIDRRRPIAQLRRVLTPALIDAVLTLTREQGRQGAAMLRRVRLRAADDASALQGDTTAAEVFATYTRGGRVRAIAARIEFVGGRWQMVALQIG